MPRNQTTNTPKNQYIPKSKQIYPLSSPNTKSTTPTILPPPTRSSISTLLYGSFLQGFGFGTGSSIGHKVVDSVISTTTKKEENISSNKVLPLDNEDNCDTHLEEFQKCLKTKDNCNILFDQYNNCINANYQNK